jgi:hypothetical protein
VPKYLRAIRGDQKCPFGQCSAFLASLCVPPYLGSARNAAGGSSLVVSAKRNRRFPARSAHTAAITAATKSNTPSAIHRMRLSQNRKGCRFKHSRTTSAFIVLPTNWLGDHRQFHGGQIPDYLTGGNRGNREMQNRSSSVSSVTSCSKFFGPAASLVLRQRPAQIFFDEWIELAVEDVGGVAGLLAGAGVFDELIGMQHVVADRFAAEADL